MNNFFDFIKTYFLQQISHIENKVFFLFILISCLFISLKKKVELYVLGTYFVISILLIPTFTCFIDGNCYSNVYLIIIAYVIANILFFIFYDVIQKQLPKTFKKLKNNESRENIYKEFGEDVYDKIDKKRKEYIIKHRKNLKINKNIKNENNNIANLYNTSNNV